jgi:hypothetical protein
MNLNNEVNNNSIVDGNGNVQNINTNSMQPSVKNKNVKIALILAVIGVAFIIGYFVYTKLFNNPSESSNCINDVQIDIRMMSDNKLVVGVGDTQYIFDDDGEYLYKALSMDEVTLNICATNYGSSINFHVGETTKSKLVQKYELYNKNNKNKITATNFNELLKELGYHAYGAYTEEVKFIGYDGYYSYEVELELSSGKKVTAECSNSFPTEKLKELEKNKNYTFVFEVKEDTFNPIKYVLNDIQ